jgi:hypothetical protein
METYFNYMADHWWVGGILSTFVLFFSYQLLRVILEYPLAILRNLTIMVKGWPPSHLDVNGKWNTQSDKESDE